MSAEMTLLIQVDMQHRCGLWIKTYVVEASALGTPTVYLRLGRPPAVVDFSPAFCLSLTASTEEPVLKRLTSRQAASLQLVSLCEEFASQVPASSAVCIQQTEVWRSGLALCSLPACSQHRVNMHEQSILVHRIACAVACSMALRALRQRSEALLYGGAYQQVSCSCKPYKAQHNSSNSNSHNHQDAQWDSRLSVAGISGCMRLQNHGMSRQTRRNHLHSPMLYSALATSVVKALCALALLSSGTAYRKVVCIMPRCQLDQPVSCHSW